MSRPVIILGAGGHAKVLVATLRLLSIQILGLTDADSGRKGALVLGMPVIGSDEEVLRHAPGAIRLVNGLGSVDLPVARKKLFDGFKARGYEFAVVVHPSAVIASDVIVDEGTQVMAGAVVQPGTRLGVNTIVNTKVSVDHDCCIGDHAHLAPGVTLSGGVHVGVEAHVGCGTTVIQGVRIGDGTLIGAGSLVLKDIPPRVKAFGVPAKVVSR